MRPFTLDHPYANCNHVPTPSPQKMLTSSWSCSLAPFFCVCVSVCVLFLWVAWISFSFSYLANHANIKKNGPWSNRHCPERTDDAPHGPLSVLLYPKLIHDSVFSYVYLSLYLSVFFFSQAKPWLITLNSYSPPPPCLLLVYFFSLHFLVAWLVGLFFGRLGRKGAGSSFGISKDHWPTAIKKKKGLTLKVMGSVDGCMRVCVCMGGRARACGRKVREKRVFKDQQQQPSSKLRAKAEQ